VSSGPRQGRFEKATASLTARRFAFQDGEPQGSPSVFGERAAGGFM
jgi:hypothetical protein